LLLIYDKKENNKEVYTYDEIYTPYLNESIENNILKEVYLKKEYTELYCLCREGVKIQLKISNRYNKKNQKQLYYLSNIHDIKHSDNCRYTGIKIEELHTWKKINGRVEAKFKLPDKMNNHSKQFNGFLRQLISESWDHVNNKKKLGMGADNSGVTIREVLKMVFSKSNHINVNELCSLYTLINNSPFNYRLIILTISSMCDIKEEGDYYILSLKNHLTDKTTILRCEKHILDVAISLNSVKEAPFIFAGFIKKDNNELISCAVAPTSLNGVVVNSAYERNLYNIFHEQNRLFRKPYIAYGELNNFNVSAILIDTKYKKGTIVEIFEDGSSNLEKNIRKNHRINYFNNLRSIGYGFWYWDINKDSTPKMIPSKKIEAKE
jgi:hypothetical protein